MAWKIVKADVEGVIYNKKLKGQENGIIEHALFDPATNFPVKKYLQVHVKFH